MTSRSSPWRTTRCHPAPASPSPSAGTRQGGWRPPRPARHPLRTRERTVCYGTLVSELSLADDVATVPETHVTKWCGTEPCGRQVDVAHLIVRVVSLVRAA
ncbi:DUF6791 domain-containing protein [Streptomyces luteolifulvus]|uniref:DUF6791 domain-containing protein n=1 Tax=Streptomyces luteolifulvus TaxID=2615112 RepID=UPI0038B5C5E7